MQPHRDSRQWLVTVALIVGICAAPPLMAQAPLSNDPAVRVATLFLRSLEAGRYDSAAARVSPAVPADALDAAALERIWTQLTGSIGALVSLQPHRVAEQNALRVVELRATFERAELLVRVVLDANDRLSGLWFLPAPAPDYTAPAYVDTAAFDEIDVTVGAADWPLAGALVLPRDRTIAVAVLVHGSGPNDRDETIGPNRPFRDLAWGLAAHGIATLRYEKRTRAHAARIDAATITIDQEVIADALAAIDSARAHPRTRDAPTFVIGHSLGGMLAPEIARQDGRLAGIVMMAAPARPFADVLGEQLTWIASLDSSGAQAAALRAVQDTVALLRAGRLPDSAIVLGASVAYIADLDRRSGPTFVRGLTLPMLLLQGGRDYQSTSADAALWREALAGRNNVTIREYDDLNHLFMTGTGRATPAEYGRSGHIAGLVIADIATWVRTIVAAR